MYVYIYVYVYIYIYIWRERDRYIYIYIYIHICIHILCVYVYETDFLIRGVTAVTGGGGRRRRHCGFFIRRGFRPENPRKRTKIHTVPIFVVCFNPLNATIGVICIV